MHKSSVVFTLTSVTLALTTIFLWRDRNISRDLADALQARITALEQLRPTVPSHQSPKPANSAAPSHAATSTLSSTVELASTTRAAAAPVADWNARERRLLRNPKYREARAAYRRLEFAARRKELIGVIHLSPENADELIDYWVESELHYLEQPHPNPTTEEEMRVRMQEIEAAKLKNEKDLRAILGDVAYANLEDYEASRQSRDAVYQLRDTLTDGDALRDDQIEALVEAMHAEQSQLKNEMREYSATLKAGGADDPNMRRRLQEQRTNRTQAANLRIHAAAATLLSSRQVDALDKVLWLRLEADQAREAIFQTKAEPGPGDGKFAKTN